MCTVVFIPQNGNYLLASLRDEDPNRIQALKPTLSISNNHFIAPIDPQGGGTWVGLNEAGTAIILLNGGFISHVKKEQYKHSRGLIVSTLLSEEDTIAKWNILDLENIEPFTLIVWFRYNLFQLVWDGAMKYELQLDATKPYIWSSSTLYDVMEKKLRQDKFDKWVKQTNHQTKESLFAFFQEGEEKSRSTFLQNSAICKTHSYTSIVFEEKNNHAMYYHDLISNSIDHQSFQTI